MIYATLKTLHLLSIVVWIGGMVFAQFFLRPALAQLDRTGVAINLGLGFLVLLVALMRWPT